MSGTSGVEPGPLASWATTSQNSTQTPSGSCTQKIWKPHLGEVWVDAQMSFPGGMERPTSVIAHFDGFRRAEDNPTLGSHLDLVDLTQLLSPIYQL
ncbi:uncharacterized protein PV06_02248 [Exophiala oligosperma]|uniref:Uncharacterized protein n=1 Tax=Exophiala oligosperma TaxID=215243 RepID=A0A0D2DTU4_9EURO|nr:uncharacterized protein PV06_02248 [Exophiala oligosperma]KIW46583.1 hypothetical protein PV06_02248 [Exophiala oligosperma]